MDNILSKMVQNESPSDEKRINYINKNKPMNTNYVNNQNLSHLNNYNNFTYNESPSSMISQGMSNVRSNPNFKNNYNNNVNNISANISNYALLRNNSIEEIHGQSYLINESGYYNQNTSIYSNDNHSGNIVSPGYKIISNGHTNNNNIKIPRKKTDQSKQISIQINDQSPSTNAKSSNSSCKSETLGNYLNDNSIGTGLGSKSKSGYDKSEISPVNDLITVPSKFKETGKKLNLIEIIENSSQSPQGAEKPKFLMNFLKERYGKEKFQNLISLIENCENPQSLLQDENQIKAVVGEDFKTAIKFLKYVLSCIQTNQKTITRNRSDSDFS